MTIVTYPAPLCDTGRLLYLRAWGARMFRLSCADRIRKRYVMHVGHCPRCEKDAGPRRVEYDTGNAKLWL
jgi:hypothetical protein